MRGNSVGSLRLIKDSKQSESKYDEIIEYLSQDNGYWLDNDKWDLTEDFFIGRRVVLRYINFCLFENERMKNEIKYYTLYSIKENYIKKDSLVNLASRFRLLACFLELYYKDKDSFKEIINKRLFLLQWRTLAIHSNINTELSLESYSSTVNSLYNFILDFYDTREETEKDIWYLKNIKGVKAGAAQRRQATSLNFLHISEYYRKTVKRYFKTLILKKAFGTCYTILSSITYFFYAFYASEYEDGFLENLSRQDIEKYLQWVSEDYEDKSLDHKSKLVSRIITFLEYIQIAQYDKAPKKKVSSLIFRDDIPRREKSRDAIKRVKFIPEPIMKQLDNSIMDLDRPQCIPIYILLRETGWRGTDILNLRYNNCLDEIWNNKEQKYNYYLCGEITKTGIAQLKIPIRDKVANMVKLVIDKAKELSTEKNNPSKYLFNTYEGKLKGIPLGKHILIPTIKRLIKQKDIRDADGELYHFRLHSLRHTRAKEYTEQGMGISVIQQILGHQSLQMTVHYATVTENTLYEKWKKTEDLNLFRVNIETNELEHIDLNSDDGENLVRYEYVKKNLDAVRVPFGVCFKPSKLPCKHQMNHCLTCASFCTTIENIPEYEEEINCVKEYIEISEKCGRQSWVEKNRQYLGLLENTLERVKEQKILHKNGVSREEVI